MIDKTLSSKISNMGVVCAMLVVLCHIFPKVKIGSFTWCIDRFINDGIGRTAVPYFFIVSGFFLARHIGEKGWWKKAVRTRLRTLIVPHLIWNFLWLLMPMALVASANLLRGRSVCSNIAIPSWGGLFALPPLGPTWYIRTLFLFIVLSPLFVTMLKSNANMTFAISFLFYVMFYRSVAVPFGTWRAIPNTPLALEGLVYFLYGIKLAMDGKSRDVSLKLTIAAVAVSVFFTVVRIYCKANGHIFLYNHIRFLVIPGFLWAMWKIVPSNSWPKWITSSAFAIYLIHPFVIFMFKKFACHRIDGFLPYFACAVLAILSPITVRCLLSAVSKRLTSVVFGGR